jgi:hypothetical protein
LPRRVPGGVRPDSGLLNAASWPGKPTFRSVPADHLPARPAEGVYNAAHYNGVFALRSRLPPGIRASENLGQERVGRAPLDR